MQDRPNLPKELTGLTRLMADERQHLSYREIERFLKRYAGLITATTLAVAALATLYTLIATPTYTGHAQILIESRLPQMLRQQLGEASLALDSPQIESQIAVLRSEQVAHGVVQKLNLAADEEFAPQSPRRGWLAMLTGGDTPPLSAAQQAQQDSITIQAFQTNLEVRRYGLSYVLDINFSSKDPEKAARIANAVADAYLSDQSSVRIGAARQASDWREEQVNRTRDLMNKAARAVQEFKAKRDYRLAPMRDASKDAGDAASPTDAKAAAPAAAGDKRDGTTLEELEATALAYRKLYETNLQSHVEALQRQALQFTDARVITVAAVPIVPSFPKSKLVILLGLSMGILLGLGGALVLHAFDQSIATPVQLEDGLGITCLGVIPPSARTSSVFASTVGWMGVSSSRRDPALEETLVRSRYRQALDAPGARFSQSLRAVRTAVNRVRKAEDLHVLGVGALDAAVGAGVVTANLAGLFVATGVRTLLVDLDGRERGLLASGDVDGVTEVLLGTAEAKSCIIAGLHGGADLLPAGRIANRSVITDLTQAEALTELLGAVAKTYELVLVALPPLVNGGDTTTFAAHMDGIIMLVESGLTSAPRVTAVASGLRSSGSRVVGAILASGEDIDG